MTVEEQNFFGAISTTRAAPPARTCFKEIEHPVSLLHQTTVFQWTGVYRALPCPFLLISVQSLHICALQSLLVQLLASLSFFSINSLFIHLFVAIAAIVVIEYLTSRVAFANYQVQGLSVSLLFAL